MITRPVNTTELPALLRLYAFLHPEDPAVDASDPSVVSHWQGIFRDERLRYFVVAIERHVVSTCTLTIIPNLTRGLRPYGLSENVVTDPAFRKRGCATKVIQFALSEAWRANCYKVMLETGSKQEETLRFYEKAGFKRGVKTGFIAYPNP